MTAKPVNETDRLVAIARECFATLDAGGQITPFSTRAEGLALQDAYRVTPLVRGLREARGEKAVGRKIGFTNRTIWPEYNVYAPIWGYMYDSTVHDLAQTPVLSLAKLSEPRIEPEVVFALKAAPAPEMDETALLSCIDWVAHGFEIVQSVFPGWKFSAADTVAAFGLHGALLIGARYPIEGRAAEWKRALSTFEIDLLCDGKVVDHGRAANVLGSPLSALHHVVSLLAHDPGNPPLGPGEIVTTGTLTSALPIAAGETWSTALTGTELRGIELRFS